MSDQKRILKLYQPHNAQKAIHECPKRFVVASWGRQSGKSTAAINHIAKKMWENPKTRYWFASPTLRQAGKMYERLKDLLFSSGAIEDDHDTKKRITLINGSWVEFVSGEVLHNLRGDFLHGAVIDEVRDQPARLWSQIIRPMLATTKGWCWFISTPNGFDNFYDLAQRHNSQQYANEWAYFRAPSTANPLFTIEEYESAKREMSESEFAQEILAEFRDLTSGKTYLNFSEQNLLDRCPWYDGQFHPLLPIILGADFNISPMAWTLLQNKIEDWHAFDEIYLKNSHTQEASKVFVEKVLNAQAMGHRANPAVIICGDATAKSRQRAAAGQSDYDILKAALKSANITFRDETPDSNPTEKDRVNNVNAKLKDASGNVHLTLNPITCPNLKKDFDRVTWRPNTGSLEKTKDPDLTHSSDGVGYPICALTPLKGIRDIGKPRIINRIL